MVVLGGMGSISGAALAAIILTILPELLRHPPHVWHVGIAVTVVAAIYSRRRLRTVLVLAGVVIALEVVRDVAIAYGIDLSRYRMILYAMTLILVMILRQQGLLGVHEIWEFDYLRPWRRMFRGLLRDGPDGGETP
jgi:ABC-type branched-subunit amino acid transport system permease subunit